MVAPPVTGSWGKLKRDDDGNVLGWHPLLAHCADVAACMEALLELPLMRERFQRLAGRALMPVDISRLTILGLYHDLGKANWGFQNKQSGPSSGRYVETAGHTDELWAALVLAPAAFKQQVWESVALPAVRGWGTASSPLLAASVSHHGRPSWPSSEHIGHLRYWRPVDAYDPLVTLREFGAAAKAWLAEAFENRAATLPDDPGFQHAFAGLVSLADWIGSDTALFPYADEAGPVDFAQARLRAREAVAALGLDPAARRSVVVNKAPSFADVYPTLPRPNAAQRTVAEAPSDPLVVILEAETGAGKTEAAFWHFRNLFVAGLVDGLYFALPTRVAATQIHRRISRAAANFFGEAASVVLAVPGYAQVDNLVGTRLPGFEVLWPDSPDDASAHRRWAAENPKRFLSAPIAVGTIDQALQAALCIRHAHLRATSLLRSLLVVDEVHASDPYMHRLLQALLNAHTDAGGRALLMSATLGSSVRSGYLRDPLQSLEDAKSQPYPVLWGRGWARPITIAPGGRNKPVAVQTTRHWDQPPDVAAVAMSAARAGAHVLVIRNTVTAAVATQEALEIVAGGSEGMFQLNGVRTLHHSRFAREDRQLLDRAVEAFIGKERTEGGGVVVGTQTLEQSLDLDADLLITDLCPVDVLLQRMGRLHRHERPERPHAFREPRCIVLTPVDRDLTPLLKRPVNGLGPLRDTTGVYPDLRVVEATWRLLDRFPTWDIPGMNRVLVESATHSAVLDDLCVELGDAWQRHAMNLGGRRIADQQHADDLTIDRSLAFGQQLFPEDEKVLTRLGADDRIVDLAAVAGHALPGPFGQPVSRLTISSHLCPGTPPDATPQQIGHESGTIRFAFGGRRFVYDRWGLSSASTD